MSIFLAQADGYGNGGGRYVHLRNSTRCRCAEETIESDCTYYAAVVGQWCWISNVAIKATGSHLSVK